MRQQLSPDIHLVDKMVGKTMTWFAMVRWVENSQLLCHEYIRIWLIFGDANLMRLDKWYSWIFWDQSSSSNSRLYGSWEGSLRSWKKIRVQGKMTRQISLMSWTMRGYYTLEPLAYGFHKICVWLVYLIESPLYKYLVKYRYHVTSLINIGPGSCGHFMEPQAVQQYIHTPRMQKRVCQANFICICLLYRLCRHQEQNH